VASTAPCWGRLKRRLHKKHTKVCAWAVQPECTCIPSALAPLCGGGGDAACVEVGVDVGVDVGVGVSTGVPGGGLCAGAGACTIEQQSGVSGHDKTAAWQALLGGRTSLRKKLRTDAFAQVSHPTAQVGMRSARTLCCALSVHCCDPNGRRGERLTVSGGGGGGERGTLCAGGSPGFTVRGFVDAVLMALCVNDVAATEDESAWAGMDVVRSSILPGARCAMHRYNKHGA